MYIVFSWPHYHLIHTILQCVSFSCTYYYPVRTRLLFSVLLEWNIIVFMIFLIHMYTLSSCDHYFIVLFWYVQHFIVIDNSHTSHSLMLDTIVRVLIFMWYYTILISEWHSHVMSIHISVHYRHHKNSPPDDHLFLIHVLTYHYSPRDISDHFLTRYLFSQHHVIFFFHNIEWYFSFTTSHDIFLSRHREQNCTE